MEHLRWTLCKKYKEFNRNIIVKAVKESFIYNLLKALIVILLILLLIFQIKPKKAYIYAELEQVDESSFSYHAKAMYVDDISYGYMLIRSVDKILINLNGISINDVDYSNGYYLEICPIENYNSSIAFWGRIDCVDFPDAISNINEPFTTYSNLSLCHLVGEQDLEINYGTAYIININTDEIKKLDSTETLTLMDTYYKEALNNFKKLIKGVSENENKYQKYIEVIDYYSKRAMYSVEIHSEPANSKYKDTQFKTSFVTINSLYSKEVTSCGVIASGKLTVSYTPTPEEYTLNKQELYLLSEDSSLTISYDSENNTASVSGYVNEAMLSQMNLFPDFWNWYFSNVYMAPLTLVSTVFAAVSMMNASKKNK